MTTIQKIAITLNSPSDWEIWIDMVENRARIANVWQFINPYTEKDELPMLTSPTFPMSRDVNPRKNIVSELSPEELEELKALRNNYKIKNREYEQQKSSIETLHTLVHETVSRNYYTYLIKKTTLYDMLKALQQRVAPSDKARELELIAQYQKLKQTPKNQNIDSWLRQWETTYNNCKEANLPDVIGTRPIYDFVNAIQEYAPDFAGAWIFKIQRREKNKKEIPDIFEVLEHFRNHVRVQNAQKGQTQASHGAFTSSFRGQKLDDKDKEEKAQRPCLCGKSHKFKSCWYLMEELRPANWKPDSTIQKQIEEKLQKHEKLREAVERIRGSKKNDSNKSTNNASGASKDNEKKAEYANFMVSTSGSEPSEYRLRDSVILDSGASLHICNDRSRFKTFEPATEESYVYAGNTVIPIEGFGHITVTVQAPGGSREINLWDVAYIPSFHTTVASLEKFTSKGVHWDTENNRLTYYWDADSNRPTNEKRTFCTLERHCGQWTLEYHEREIDSVFAAQTIRKDTTAEIWHQRLGHIGPDAVQHLTEAPKDDSGPTTIECETCMLSKAHQIVSRQPQRRAEIPFEKVHFDLIPMTLGYNGDRYTAHFLCDCTKMNYVYTIPRKSSSFTIVRDFIAFALRRYGQDIQVIRLDGETSLGLTFNAWANELGVVIERSAAYTPAQNGAAERHGKELTTKARAMRIGSNLPEDLWPEAVKTAGYLLNRTPTKILGWKSPLQALQAAYGQEERQNLNHLWVFGCRAYPTKHKVPRLQKTLPRAHIGYLVGYNSTNIFRIWIPSKKKVIATRDVTFNESLFYDPREADLARGIREIDEIIEVFEMPKSQQQELDYESDTDSDIDVPMAKGKEKQRQDDIYEMENLRINEDRHTQERILQEQAQQDYKDGDQDFLPGAFPDDVDAMTGGYEPVLPTPKPKKARKPRDTSQGMLESNILEGGRSRKPTEKVRKQAYHVALQTPEDLKACYNAFGAGMRHRSNRLHRDDLPEPPNTWAELQKHPYKEEFLRAAEKEYGDLLQRKTFEKVERPRNTRILPVRWVFVYKFDTDGYLEKYKARLCVRGDLQEHSLQDNYAATLAARTFRALMAITAAYDLEAYQFDAVSAFTNSKLDWIVYIECPDGFKEKGKCFLLLRALYGLRESPRLWLKDLTGTLLELELYPSCEEVCLFLGDGLILFFYVDDMVALFWKKDEKIFLGFKEKLMSRYDIREIGELNWFLGIRIVRDRAQKKLWLCQDSYISKIAASFHLDDRRAVYTPMTTDALRPYDGQATPQEIHMYQRKVGSALYVTTISRPDGARAASKLSEYLQNPSPQHQQEIDHAIVYLNTFRNLAIEFSADASEKTFTCASDAAFADDVPSRKSTEGYLFSLFGGPIDWRSTKQRTVTTSSTEAELLAMTHTAKELAWWKRFFSSIEFDPGHDFKIHADNMQSIRIITTTTPQFSTKLRHVDISKNWLRQEVQAERLAVEWIPTAEMPADGLTKALSRQKHEKFVKQLGLTDIGHLIKEDTTSRKK